MKYKVSMYDFDLTAEKLTDSWVLREEKVVDDSPTAFAHDVLRLCWPDWKWSFCLRYGAKGWTFSTTDGMTHATVEEMYGADECIEDEYADYEPNHESEEY